MFDIQWHSETTVAKTVVREVAGMQLLRLLALLTHKVKVTMR